MDIFQILVGVVTVITVGLITLKLVTPIVVQVAKFVEARSAHVWADLTDRQRQELSDLVKQGRLAFAQLNADGKITNAVDAELKHVTALVQAWFDLRGWDINITQIESELAAQIMQGIKDAEGNTASG